MLTPNQPVFVLSLYCCRRIREATSTRSTTIYLKLDTLIHPSSFVVLTCKTVFNAQFRKR